MKKFLILLFVSLLVLGTGVTASARHDTPANTTTALTPEDGSSGTTSLLFTDAYFTALAEDVAAPSARTLKALPRISVQELKQAYNTGTYSYRSSDPYNPVSAGLESLLIPGLGQMVAGYAWRGAIFFAAESLFATAAAVAVYPAYYRDVNYKVNTSVMYACLGLVLVTHVWSVVDAVQVAKLKNLYLRDVCGHQHGAEIGFAPYVTVSPTLAGNVSPQAGLGVRLNF